MTDEPILADGAHQQRELPDELAKDRINAAPFPANVSGDVQISAMGVFRQVTG